MYINEVYTFICTHPYNYVIQPVNQLVVQRVMLQKQLQSNCEDQQTILALADIEKKVSASVNNY